MKNLKIVNIIIGTVSAASIGLNIYLVCDGESYDSMVEYL